jgi:cellulose synthase/poly-beta-1,6-N-acetylglucosamine synthase-like glycosyltransferase
MNFIRTATILITTKDRAQLFEAALRSALDQDFPSEIVIVDDGSSDNTSSLARELCPQGTLLRNETAVGIIAARNQGFRHATGDVVFTLDDDATFSSREVVSSVMAEFDRPYIGAVEIPLIDHLPDGSTHQRLPIENPAEDFLCVPVFTGAANAIRRDLFDACGGYSGSVRQGEERGVAIKMLDLGAVVRVASRHHVDHYPQPRVGDRSDILYWSARNNLQFGWNYVPSMRLPSYVVITVLKQIKNGISKRNLYQPISAMCASIGDLMRLWGQRRPVSQAAYGAFQEISRRKVLRFSEVSAILQKHGKELASA